MNEINEIHFPHLPKKVEIKKQTAERKETVSDYSALKMYSDSKTAEISSAINISDKQELEKLVEIAKI